MSACFDVNIASVSACQFFDLCNNIFFSRVHNQVSSELFCFLKTCIIHIQYDEELRICLTECTYHTKSECSYTRLYNNVGCLNLCTVYAVERACIWLDQRCLLDRHICRYEIWKSFFCQFYILSHTTIYVLLESEQIMFLTHPMTACLTEHTLSARNDLFRTDTVT